METSDPWLSARRLAVLVGLHRGEVPVSEATVRRWMRSGVRGVVLYSEWDVNGRRTTWGHFLAFRAEIARRVGLERESRQAAASRVKGWTKRMQKAKAELERLGLG